MENENEEQKSQLNMLEGEEWLRWYQLRCLRKPNPNPITIEEEIEHAPDDWTMVDYIPSNPYPKLLRKKNNELQTGSEDREGLSALFDFFKVAQSDPKKWELLALRLAQKHVPRFSNIYDHTKGLESYVHIQKIIYRRNCNLTKALERYTRIQTRVGNPHNYDYWKSRYHEWIKSNPTVMEFRCHIEGYLISTLVPEEVDSKNITFSFALFLLKHKQEIGLNASWLYVFIRLYAIRKQFYEEMFTCFDDMQESSLNFCTKI